MKPKLLLFIFIFIIGLFLRLYKLSELPPPIHVDEAFMTQSAIAILEQSKNLLDTYFSTTVISNLFTAIFIKIFGLSITSLRFHSVLFGILTNLLVFFLVKDMFNEKIALISFFIVSTSHLAIAYSRINLPNIQAPFLLILALYLVNYAIKQKKNHLFSLAGLATGLSFYSYTGAKIIIVVILIFLLINHKKMKVRFWLSFLIGLLLITTPIIIYITKPTNNYLERENQVFILNNHTYWHDRWQTDNLWVVLFNQLKINFFSFFNTKDFSNQYGNRILLDKLSSYIFLLFFFILIPIIRNLYHRDKIEEIKNLLFFMISFIIIIFAISFTESPPLSTRLVILYPIISLLISLTIHYLILLLKSNFLIRIYLTTILLIILVLNFKIYFYDYIKNKSAAYHWIEPNSSIGFYTQKIKNRNIYLLSNPHTYPDEAIISVLNYKKNKIKEIKEIKNFEKLIKQASSFDIIIPLVPKEAVDSNTLLKNLILESTNNNKFKKIYYWGIPCAHCEIEPIFLVISKI